MKDKATKGTSSLKLGRVESVLALSKVRGPSDSCKKRDAMRKV